MPLSDDTPKSDHTSKYIRWAINAALGAAFILEVAAPGAVPKLDDVIIVLAAVASMAALNSRLPLQNVLLAAFVAALLGGLAHGLTARTGIPFGPMTFHPPVGNGTNALISDTEIPLNPVTDKNQTGGILFHFVPWTVPFLWIAAIFNARGVTRLILRPWRKVKNYGFWLIGLTAVLVVAFDVALEPFAVQVKHLWHWQRTKIPLTWHGATPVNFLSWAFVALLILAFATPALIKKQPGQRNTPDYHPLAVWLGALVLFAVGSARAGLWLPVGVDAAIAVVTAVFAYRGARW